MSTKIITQNDLKNILEGIVNLDGTDMDSEDLSDFVNSLGVKGIHAVDYVVEQSTSGNWKYRKWNSGAFDAWASEEIVIACTTQSEAYGGYRTANPVTISIPSVMQDWNFSHIHVSKMSAGSVWTNDYYRDNNNNVAGYWHNGVSATDTRVVSIYVHGTWK